MLDFNKKPYTAKEYVDYLNCQFGLVHENDARVTQASNKVWAEWQIQGISKPVENKDFDTAVNTPLILMSEYFKDIIATNKDLKDYNPNKTIFHILPWSEFNAGANTLADNERVILFDSSLISFLNAVSILIMHCVYSHPSEQEAEHYEGMVLTEFDKFIDKNTIFSTQEIDTFSERFQKIVMQDYDLTYFGASSAVAMNCFIICHEVAHFVLEHSGNKHCLKYALSNGESANIEINKINQFQEFEADMYGYQLFLQLIEGSSLTKRVKLSEHFQLMPLIFFEIIDLVFAYAKSKHINYYEKNTHPQPLERKKRLMNVIDDKNSPLANELYEAFMDFSRHVRKRF